MNENNLIKRIAENDPAAEKELIRLFYSKIRMIIAIRINDAEDQKELVNDILVAVLLKIRDGSYDRERDTGLANYVNGITRNMINQYFKKLYRRREQDNKLKTEMIVNKHGADIERFEFEKAEEIQANRKIWRALIDQLKPKYREVIYLRYYDNLSVTEIGEKLDIPAQKVSDYLKYAKQLLMQNFLNKK